MKKNTIIAIILGLIIVGAGITLSIANKPNNISHNTEPRDTCVEHTGLGMHIHPQLEIWVDNQKVPIPADIGITTDCMKAIHTHDETGKLHLEYSKPHDFLLKDFFSVWGKNFSKDEVLDKKIDDQHIIEMTVDGQPNTEYENLVLKDLQQIIIRYQAKPQ